MITTTNTAFLLFKWLTQLVDFKHFLLNAWQRCANIHFADFHHQLMALTRIVVLGWRIAAKSGVTLVMEIRKHIPEVTQLFWMSINHCSESLEKMIAHKCVETKKKSTAELYLCISALIIWYWIKVKCTCVACYFLL